MSVDQLSMVTRIKPQFIDALEEMRLEDLPSRAFVVGYVRACAVALGFDAEAAVERFKREVPEQGAVLATPVSGEQHERADPRFRMLVGLGVLVVGAIIAWNITERVRNHAPVRRSSAPAARSAPASARGPAGPVSLGAPLPPPAEASNPEPYLTPGLTVGSSAPAAAQTASFLPPAGSPFQPKPRVQVYGSAATAHLILQAVRPASLVVKGSDGKVYFARQLEAGEAYAVPALEGLTFEVSNPAVVGLYVDRVLRGPLPAATGTLSSLAAAPAAAAHP